MLRASVNSAVTRFILLMFSLFFLHTLLPGGTESKYIFKAWRIEDGLPQNSILSLIQARNGYIWFGTELGLVRFNGLDFRIFNRWNTPSLGKNRIRSLHEDQNGKLWIGTDGGGLCSLDRGRWQIYGPEQGLNSKFVKAICQDTSGRLWLGTHQGLYLLQGQTFRLQESNPTLANSSIETLLPDTQGNVWIGTNQGLFFSNQRQHKKEYTFIPLMSAAVTALYQDKRGFVYVGTENGLIQYSGKDQVKRITRSNGLSGNHVTSILVDRLDQLWVGTFGDGLCRVGGAEPLCFTANNGLSDDFINTMMEDREGNIWIGTFAGGIIRMKSSPFSFLTRQHGLPEDHISTIWVEKNGLTWIGTRRRGLCKIRDKKILKIYSRRNGLSSNEIQALCKTSQGDLWIGTRGGGLNQLREEKISVFSLKDGLAGDDVRTICQDRRGILWIGTSKGLHQFRYGKIVNVLEVIEPFRGKTIHTLYEDSHGVIWVASAIGLSSISKDMVRHFKLGGEAAELDVRAICEAPDQSGILWLATRNNGLLRFKDGEIIRFGLEKGLHSNNVFSLLQAPIPYTAAKGEKGITKNMFLWMGSYSGIVRLSLQELNKSVARANYILDPILYNEEEGMLSSECTWWGQPSAFQSDNGQLFFSTIKGLAMLSLAEVKTDGAIPPVIIEEVFVNNRSVVNQGNLKIPEGKQMVEFYFSALTFSAPQKSKFRYKLEGFEEQWTTLEPAAKRSALFINLKPGTYTFRVTSANHHGIWNTKGASFRFKSSPVSEPVSKR